MKAIAQGLAKNSFFLPASGWRAPRCRFRNFGTPASAGVPLRALSITLTNACVSTLNRSGPFGEAAMFGRYAWLPRITMLCSWFGNAEVGSGTPSPLESIVNPVICGARVTRDAAL